MKIRKNSTNIYASCIQLAHWAAGRQEKNVMYTFFMFIRNSSSTTINYRKKGNKLLIRSTACPRNFDPFYTVTYDTECVKTFWTYSI